MQTLLLVLGVALVVIAVFAFAWFAYGLLGDVARTACVIAVGALALGVAVALTPRLRVTAEGLAWAGLIALVIGAILVSTIGGPHVSGKTTSLVAGALLLTACAAALGLRRLPLPAGVPPLRAYSLFATFALPVAVMMMTHALPVPDDPQLLTLQSVLGGGAAVLFAAMVPADPRRRTPDFERVAALVVATVILVFGSVELAMAIDYGDPLWASALLVPSVSLTWLGVATVTYTRTMARTGRAMPSRLRFVPVAALVWIPAVSTTLLMRVLPSSMPLETQRMCAYLPAVVLAAQAVVAACAMPSDPSDGHPTGSPSASAPRSREGVSEAGATVWPTFGTVERVSAALNGSLVLLIMVCGEFGRDGFAALVTAMTAFAGLLAASACAWMRAATPVLRPVRSRDRPPMPVPAATSPMPQPYAPIAYPPAMEPPAPYPVMPQPPYPPASPAPYPQIMMVPKARGADAAGVIATVAAALATVFLFFSTLAVPRPYAPVDLICGAVGVVALAAGIRWLGVWPRVRSRAALWPALTLLMAPPLVVSWTSPLSFPRALILFAVALAMVLWGALRGLQAPLVAGTAVIVAHMVTVLWPWLAVFSRRFWWVWLLVGGVVLIAAAARYEASLKTMRSLATRIGQLR
ncbi:SCO7613 C-terminal domain-containing membrane protein [Bifidobacterium platyrrhinorum]|uniref:Uncharacterized protein n=1 Tax=Bifidobacterium platyrrhinorum TaxID=2661628 RepID=A0A6L9SVN1_9BIFI|nr:hypothetical protein [Bifidobacterium platyrrhinorum]NEG55211.1 hypothetical protein [Bifidobacterium platyrrhinorum]